MTDVHARPSTPELIEPIDDAFVPPAPRGW